MKSVAFMVKTFEGGGAQRVINTLSKSFIEKGIDVHIITMFHANGYDVPAKVRMLNLDISRENRSVDFNRAKIEVCASYIKKNNIDTLIIGSTSAPLYEYALFIKETNDIRIVAQMTNAPDRSPVALEERQYRDYIFDKLYAEGAGFIFQTPYERDYFPDPIRDKACIIDNPLMQDIPAVSYEKVEPIIVSAGRFDEQKNFELLINAFHLFVKKKQNYKLYIYGRGHMESVYRSLIERLSLENKVFLVPFTTKLHSLIRNASVFVQSSNYEGVSNILLEAMAMGLPVISTDCPAYGGRSFIVERKNGILIQAGDLTGLVSSMEEITCSEYYKKNACEEAYNIRKRLNAEYIAELYIDYIEQL